MEFPRDLLLVCYCLWHISSATHQKGSRCVVSSSSGHAWRQKNCRRQPSSATPLTEPSSVTAITSSPIFLSSPSRKIRPWADLGTAEDHPEISSAFCMLNVILRYSMSLFSTQKLRRFLLSDWNLVANGKNRPRWCGGGQVRLSTRVKRHTAAASLWWQISLYEDRGRTPEGPLGYLSWPLGTSLWKRPVRWMSFWCHESWPGETFRGQLPLWLRRAIWRLWKKELAYWSLNWGTKDQKPHLQWASNTS